MYATGAEINQYVALWPCGERWFWEEGAEGPLEDGKVYDLEELGTLCRELGSAETSEDDDVRVVSFQDAFLAWKQGLPIEKAYEREKLGYVTVVLDVEEKNLDAVMKELMKLLNPPGGKRINYRITTDTLK